MREVRAPLSYLMMCSTASSSHWGRSIMIQEAGTLPPWIQQCADRKIVISILLFAYPQVRE